MESHIIRSDRRLTVKNRLHLFDDSKGHFQLPPIAFVVTIYLKQILHFGIHFGYLLSTHCRDSSKKAVAKSCNAQDYHQTDPQHKCFGRSWLQRLNLTSMISSERQYFLRNFWVQVSNKMDEKARLENIAPKSESKTDPFARSFKVINQHYKMRGQWFVCYPQAHQ